MKAKILIGTPTHQSKDYAWAAFNANVQNILSFARKFGMEIDFYVSDNSPTPDYASYLSSHGIQAQWTRPGKCFQESLCNSHNAIRKVFLEGSYTHLLHLESDLFPPYDIVHQLLQCNVPVVTAMYHVQQGKASVPQLTFLCGNGTERIDYPVPRQYASRYITGGLVQCYATGIGCTLMQRKVMEKISFRHQAPELWAPDTFFYRDLVQHDIPLYCHTGIICDHQNEDWSANLDFNQQYQKQTAEIQQKISKKSI